MGRRPGRRGRRYDTVHSLHHLLAYDLVDGAGTATLADSTAVPDQSFSIRNGHFIFTEPYQMISSLVVGNGATDGRLNMPSINAIGYHHLWGVSRSATIPTPLVISDYRSGPIVLPQYEEMSVQLSDNQGAATNILALILLAPTNWTQNLPQGMKRLTVKFTATVNTGAFLWSGLTPLVFEATLKGGWYSVVGCEVQGTNLLAFQLNFPRFPLVQGRKLYPGTWAMNAVGNYPPWFQRDVWGWWGTFHTFEVPLIQGMSAAGGNITCTGYVDLVYHGDQPPAGTVSLGTP
jgi:hypothetical protein